MAAGATDLAREAGGAATPGAGADLRVRIARSDPRARREFQIRRDGVRVVLDALSAVERQDPSLTYRYSCRSGFCGTCTVVVDGRPALACQTPVDPGATTLTVAPLGGFPVLDDLVVDPRPFAERWRAVPPATPSGHAAPAEHLDCISCAACLAACDAWTADRRFVGPAALTRLLVVGMTDLAAGGLPGSAETFVGHEGCHGIGACTLACPKGLDPARAIRRLRRAQGAWVGP